VKQKLAAVSVIPCADAGATLSLQSGVRGLAKIQYRPTSEKELRRKNVSQAVDECGAPTVSIPGGEPLMHSQIDKIVEGLVARKKYIYLCTNALLLKEKLHCSSPALT